jgi:hypothetical protein
MTVEDEAFEEQVAPWTSFTNNVRGSLWEHATSHVEFANLKTNAFETSSVTTSLSACYQETCASLLTCHW